MEKYWTEKISENNYILVCADFHSIMEYFQDIMNEAFIQNGKGTLIVDQLLVTGNCDNRFLCCDFSFGKLTVLNEISNQLIEKSRRTSTKILKHNIKKIQHSILTESQLEQLSIGYEI